MLDLAVLNSLAHPALLDLAANDGPNFGHMTEVRYIGAESDAKFVVIPKHKSFYAVEVKLLQMISDVLNFGGGSFKPAVLQWYGQRQGHQQQRQ